MAQNNNVTPLKSNSKPKDIVAQLKQDNWYILTLTHQPKLYHPEHQQEIPLASILSRNQQDKAKEQLPKITEITFQPNKPEIKTAHLGVTVNTYKPFKPSSAGGSKETLYFWQEFLERLFPLKSERKAVEQFIAHMVQVPEERPSYGLMLTSASGTGKGWFYANILAPVLSHQCYQVGNFSALFGKHSTVLHQSLCVWLDDPKSCNNNTMTKLRHSITEPRVLIEPKQEKERMVQTFSRIILASNEQCPLQLSEHDTRRWLIPQFIQHRESQKETKAFLEEFSKVLCIDTLHRYFSELDITDFDPFFPLDTETKQQILELSEPEIKHQVERFVENKCQFDWLSLELYLDCETIHTREVAEILNSLGFFKKRVTRDGRKVTIWQKRTGVDKGKA